MWCVNLPWGMRFILKSRLTPRISGLGQKGSCVITFAQSNTFKMVADSSGVFGRRKANCSKVRYTVDSSCKITFDRASGHCDFSAHTCVLLSLLLRLRVLIVGTNKGLPWDTVGAACRLGMNLVARDNALNRANVTTGEHSTRQTRF